jgi:inosose dehydratase
MPTNRRRFLGEIAVLASAGTLGPVSQTFASGTRPPYPISCNQYTWFTFFKREGRDWNADLDASLAEYTQSGFEAFEPSLTSEEEVTKLAPLLKAHNLLLPSFYVNSTLHDAREAEKSINTVLAIARAAKLLGAKIVVTNPSPIEWGGAQNKSDAQLTIQAQNLDRLGAALRAMGMTLSYHTHDVELRAAAREFHHMLLATNPQYVSLCLDVHWIYRGSGNSEVALFDIVKLYGKRITELHLRQSVDGVWSETFGPGDIDYSRLVANLKKLGVSPHLVVEQCLEAKSPHIMTSVEAHRRDLEEVRKIFAPL